MGTTIKPPKNTGGTTYTAGNGIALSGDEFSSKTDGTTLTNTGGGSSDSLAVLKVPGRLYVAGSLSVSASGYDGSGDVTITGGTIPGSSDDVQYDSFGVGTAASGTTGDITFTNVLKAPAGSNSAPSIAYSSDTDTGIYFGSAKVAVTVSGTEEVAVGTNGMQLTSSLGVGTAASGTTGEIRATNDITAFYSSDKRLKDNITPITEPLSKLSQLGGYTFDWIPKEGIHSHEGRDVGVIAQEVEEVLPEVTTTRGNGYKAVRYEKIVPLLIECIKAQQYQIDELKESLSELKKK